MVTNYNKKEQQMDTKNNADLQTKWTQTTRKFFEMMMKMRQPQNINSLNAYLKFLVTEQMNVDCRLA